MSPTAVDRLEPESTDAQVQAAVSDCIAAEVRNGTEQQQAIAMCHEMMRKKTGRQQPAGGGQPNA